MNLWAEWAASLFVLLGLMWLHSTDWWPRLGLDWDGWASLSNDLSCSRRLDLTFYMAAGFQDEMGSYKVLWPGLGCYTQYHLYHILLAKSRQRMKASPDPRSPSLNGGCKASLTIFNLSQGYSQKIRPSKAGQL